MYVLYLKVLMSTDLGSIEMVEPVEETRNEVVFATEPLLSSLHLSIPSSSRSTPLVELDEVEACGTYHSCASLV